MGELMQFIGIAGDYFNGRGCVGADNCNHGGGFDAINWHRWSWARNSRALRQFRCCRCGNWFPNLLIVYTTTPRHNFQSWSTLNQLNGWWKDRTGASSFLRIVSESPPEMWQVRRKLLRSQYIGLISAMARPNWAPGTICPANALQCHLLWEITPKGIFAGVSGQKKISCHSS